MSWMYAMTQRPAGPGAQPKGVVEIMPGDPDKVDERIGHRVWNFVRYDRKLTDEEVSDYELTPYIRFEDLVKEMYRGAWYTITGAGGDLNEWKDGYQGLLNERGIGTITRWETFSGAEMNRHFRLHGNNRYPDDLTFLAFPLDGLDQGKLPLFKLEMQDRWFNDIVDNNARREDEMYVGA